MMNYSLLTAICVVVILIITSLVWNRVFMSYLRKSEINKSKHGGVEKKTILNLIKPTACLGGFIIMCSILLSNTDDEVADALDYIRPSKRLNNLLEKINEQAGI